MSKGEARNSIDTNRSDDSIMESHSQLRRFQFALTVSLWMLYTNRAVPSLKLAACLLVKSVPWSGKELKSTVSLPGDALLIHLTALNQNYPPQCKKWASPSAEVHSAPLSPPERALGRCWCQAHTTCTKQAVEIESWSTVLHKESTYPDWLWRRDIRICRKSG